MKTIIILLFCISGSIHSQINISGKFCDDSGIYLYIEDNTFKLIIPNPARNGIYSEIMAEDKFNQINKSFIELNSIVSPYEKVSRSLKIDRRLNDSHIDSLKVEFIIPYTRGNLTIVVYTDKFKTYKLRYSTNQHYLYIPRNVERIAIHIEPIDIEEHSIDGRFFGLVGFDFLEEFTIESNTNEIIFDIPAIDNSFFETYYVKGEYAQITKDSIIWKGNRYVKCND